MREAMGLLGLAGIVLLVFGLVPFVLSGVFDLWTALHVTGGGILVATAGALNFANLRRTLASRGARERLRVAAGGLLFVGLLITVNVIAARHPRSWDATENRIHTLSEKTLAVIRGLEQPVELIAFVAGGSPARGDLGELLERFATESPALTWRFADPVREPELATELGVRDEGVVVARLGSVSARGSGHTTFGWTEGALTHLLLKVSRPGPRVIYALSGHGEGAPDDAGSPDGLGLLAAALAEESFEVRSLLLSAEARVPEDTALLVIAGPVKPLTEHEVEQIEAWIDRGGRVLLMVDPGTAVGLGELLASYRIAIRDDVIVDPGRAPFVGSPLGLATIVDDFPAHPITRGFHERIALDRARSVDVLSSGRLPGVAVEAAVLARTGERAWAERDFETMIESRRVDRSGEETTGPLPVAVAARAPRPGEPRGTSSPPEARWVVIGDSQIARNVGIGVYFNREFLLNAVEWLVGNEPLIAAGPRGLRPSRLDMTRADYRNLFRFAVLLLPEILVILGLSVWWWRRSL